MPNFGGVSTAGGYFVAGNRTKYGTLVASGVIPHHPDWPERTLLGVSIVAIHGSDRLPPALNKTLGEIERAIAEYPGAPISAIRYEVYYTDGGGFYHIFYIDRYYGQYKYEEEYVPTEAEPTPGGFDPDRSPDAGAEADPDGQDEGELEGGNYQGHWHHGEVNTVWCTEDDDQSPGGEGDASGGEIIAETEAGWVRLTVDRMTNFHEPIFLPVRNVAWSMLNESVRVDGSLLR